MHDKDPASFGVEPSQLRLGEDFPARLIVHADLDRRSLVIDGRELNTHNLRGLTEQGQAQDAALGKATDMCPQLPQDDRVELRYWRETRCHGPLLIHHRRRDFVVTLPANLVVRFRRPLVLLKDDVTGEVLELSSSSSHQPAHHHLELRAHVRGGCSTARWSSRRLLLLLVVLVVLPVVLLVVVVVLCCCYCCCC